MIAIMAVLRRIVADLVILNVVLLSLSSCCVGRVINTRDVGEELLQKRELDMVVKELYAELMEESNDIQTTAVSIPTTTSKQQQQQPDADLYIQHIVYCYKSYQFVTEQGLSERDDIYNIVNVQCMADPEVARLVKLLTVYYLYDNTFFFDENSGGEYGESNIIEEDISTTAEPPTTTNKVAVTTQSPLDEDENDDEEAVSELLLERIMMIMKKQRPGEDLGRG
ncbi:uncharacterized protein [Antedon mediterranea]|uniref:uncharacterized protein n=1 Tax=Antedon mediterranea TaxID=105859 RepID=UPI003AF9B324